MALTLNSIQLLPPQKFSLAGNDNITIEGKFSGVLASSMCHKLVSQSLQQRHLVVPEEITCLHLAAKEARKVGNQQFSLSVVA
jgi:hypothetical protein